MSTDPALGEYIPGAGGDNSQLPGMGGIYNYVNMHLYHYAGNNPVRYTDPTGMFDDISESAKEFIKDYEGGFRDKMYETSPGNGDWTIGYGHQLTQAEIDSGTYKDGITKEQAEALFESDLQTHIEGVNRNVENSDKLTQNQFDALVSASYNMGRPSLANSKIVEVVESFGDNIASPETTDTDAFKITIADGFRHHIPTGAINAGIKNRRYNEYQMFTSGDYKRDPTPSHLIPWSAGELP